MKVNLMDPVEDFNPEANESLFADDVVQDLELDYLFTAMAGGDSYLRGIARAAVLAPVNNPNTIKYRQGAYSDCVELPAETADLYKIAVDALDLRRGIFMAPLRNHPEMELSYSVRFLDALTGPLDLLRSFRTSSGRRFKSEAFQNLLGTIDRDLDDEYMDSLRTTLQELSFPAGLLMSAGIGSSGEVIGQVLRRGKNENKRLFDRTPLKRPLHSFNLPERDEAGSKALSELRDRSLNNVANAASQATDHVLAFFKTLRAEVGFYLACANLTTALDAIGAPTCMPDPGTADSTLAAGLYDPCLALHTSTVPVGNAVDLGASKLLIITGANQGGKSTLLRALGCAQLMMQAGLPVPATKFAARPVGRVFTHWAREEDTGLTRGKLDEELDRMEKIISTAKPGDLLLCNESFASTNESEGSQILGDVTEALVHANVQVRSVTHLYTFATAIAQDRSLAAVFLRAPRADDAKRSFILEPGLPLPTSYGLDLFDNLFGTDYANAQ